MFVDVVGLTLKRGFGHASGVRGISAEELQDSRNLTAKVRGELFIADRQNLKTPGGEVIGPRCLFGVETPFDPDNLLVRRCHAREIGRGLAGCGPGQVKPPRARTPRRTLRTKPLAGRFGTKQRYGLRAPIITDDIDENCCRKKRFENNPGIAAKTQGSRKRDDMPPMNFDTPNTVLRRRDRHNLCQIFGP